MLASVSSALLRITVHLYAIVDSKELFSSLSTCRTTEDKSIGADVKLLRYNFETHLLDKVVWIARSANPANPLTRTESPLMTTLQIMIYDGTIPIYLDKVESCFSCSSLG